MEPITPVVGQGKEAEEEILLAEDDSDPIETLTTMVTGCEHFVTAAIVGIQGDVRTQCEKTVSELEDKLAKRDGQIEAINRQLADLERRLAAREEEIEGLKRNTPCKCKELFENFVTCGNAVFSGQTLLFVTNPPDTAPTNSAASATVWPESTFGTSVVDSVSFDSTTSTPLTANLLGDYNPRVIVEPMPSFSSIFGDQGTRPVMMETLEDLPAELRTEVSKYTSARSPATTNEKLTELQIGYVKYIMNRPENKGMSPSSLARQCIQRGIIDKIWTPQFVPPGVQDFYKYLHQRMRNLNQQRRAGKLTSMAKSQAERLEGMCQPKKARLS